MFDSGVHDEGLLKLNVDTYQVLQEYISALVLV